MASIQLSLKEMLESLDIPVEDNNQHVTEISPDKFVTSVSHYVTEDVARRLWLNWNPDLVQRSEDPKFLSAFREILAQAASLGFNLNRFKEISKKLPDPSDNLRNWIPLFEEVINNCNLRICLSNEDYKNWLRTESSVEKEKQRFKEKIAMMTDGLFSELGLVFPPIDFQVDKELTSPYFKIEWNNFKLPARKGLLKDKVLVNDTVDRLTLLNIKGEETRNPANGNECAFISSEFAEIAEQAGLTTWDSAGYLILSVTAIIRKNAAAFVNRSFIDLLLYQLDKAFPATVEQINKNFDKDFLVRIIRGLLAEEISIRNLYSILDTILSVRSIIHVDFSKFIVFLISGGIIVSKKKKLDESNVNDYVEIVRNSLKRYISHKYTRGGNTLVVYLMDPTVESRLSQSQNLTEAERNELIIGVRNEVGNLPPTAQMPVILTTMEIRHRLRREIQSEFPYIAVLSYQELSPDMNIQPIARLSPELFPFNESFYQLFNTLPKFSRVDSKEVTFSIDKLSNKDKNLIEFLNKHKEDILSMVEDRIKKSHSNQQISKNDLHKLVLRFLEVHYEQLFPDQNKLANGLLNDLTQTCANDEIKFRDIFEIPLLIKSVIRSLLGKKYEDIGGQISIQEFNEDLEKSELMAHKVASKLISMIYHTKYNNKSTKI